MQLVKKLGAKQILGNVKELTKEKCEKDGDTFLAYTIFGIANGVKTGESNFGAWTSFSGDFEAVSALSGETYRGMVAFIQEPVEGILLNALENNDSVEFACDVLVKRRDELPMGYEYLLVPKTETKQSDALASLRDLALPAPEKPAKKK